MLRTLSLKDNLEKRSSAWLCAQDSFSCMKLLQLQGVDLNHFRVEVEMYLVTERFLGVRESMRPAPRSQAGEENTFVLIFPTFCLRNFGGAERRDTGNLAPAEHGRML